MDAIILTHHHMDAAAGLDDVRNFQGVKYIVDNNNNNDDTSTTTTTSPDTPNSRPVRQSIPLYLSDFCKINLQLQFPWLLPSQSIQMPKQQHKHTCHTKDVFRDVATFNNIVFEDYKTQSITFDDMDENDYSSRAFEFVPLPVWHGDDLISHGYAFTIYPTKDNNNYGYEGSNDQEEQKQQRPLHVVYLSDISRMVPETLEFIQQKLPPTDLLIVDSLLWHKIHPVHYSLDQAVELSKIIQPRVHTYLVGMSCDSFLPHDEMNMLLHKTYDGTVSFAYDGLVIDLPALDDNDDNNSTNQKWTREPIDVFND
jgi:phosphoribosyl 1,2-cyclic phosphodiesterase